MTPVAPVAPVAQPAPGAEVVELSAAEAVAWDRLSGEVGTRLLPVLEELVRGLPSVSSVLVATADGFNLCALGLADHRVEAVAAMAGALHSMASAAGGVVDDPAGGSSADLLTISHGAATTVVLTVPGLSLGPAMLWVTASRETLGTVVYRARAAVAAIGRLAV